MQISDKQVQKVFKDSNIDKKILRILWQLHYTKQSKKLRCLGILRQELQKSGIEGNSSCYRHFAERKGFRRRYGTDVIFFG